MDSDNFDLIINILIAIRRSLSNLVEIPGIELGFHEFNKRLGTENDWMSSVTNTK